MRPPALVLLSQPEAFEEAQTPHPLFVLGWRKLTDCMERWPFSLLTGDWQLVPCGWTVLCLNRLNVTILLRTRKHQPHGPEISQKSPVEKEPQVACRLLDGRPCPWAMSVLGSRWCLYSAFLEMKPGARLFIWVLVSYLLRDFDCRKLIFQFGWNQETLNHS